MRPIRTISLARSPERRALFLQNNSHLAISFSDAVDGAALSMEQIRASGLFKPEVEATYDAHGYGCALSHWHLWNEAAAGSEPLTIAEDDVVFRGDFEAMSQKVIASLPADWDLMLWGWNFDSVLVVHPMGSVSATAMVFDETQMRSSLTAFQSLNAPVHPLKLDRAFGSAAYTLSPKGAATFLKRCFPQGELSVWFPLLNKHMPNIGVDISMNAAYPETQCFACFPPLAVTPNEKKSSNAAA